MTALAIIPYTLLAQGIYSGLISAVSSVTVGTCHIVRSIYTHQNPDVTKVIKELDIERRLKLIQSVLNAVDQPKQNSYVKMKLNNLEKTQIFEIVGETNLGSDPIKLCLFYLHDIIQEIHNNLFDINKKVAYHNTKWLSTWRTLNIGGLLDNLRLNSKLLDSRFNDLTKISMFLANKC